MERPHKRDLPQCSECLDTGRIEYSCGDDEAFDCCACEAGEELRWRDDVREEDEIFRRLDRWEEDDR